MAKFDPPIHIKQPDEDDKIIVFGKSPALKEMDVEKGIARFGGPWRTPSYLHAYLRSADILVNEGVRTKTLDDLGLPIFYIQRHTLELLLKRLLSWVYEIAEFRNELGIETFRIPDDHQKAHFKKSHNLAELCKDLEVTTKAFSFGKLPEELAVVVKRFVEIEMTETWSRYETSPAKVKGGPDLKHTEDTDPESCGLLACITFWA